ncbi:type IX secretion system ring subunit PorN/GldN [Flavobacterium urocaniciphilum]|uniref:Protein involved in gliding motility GldN n=1 Tax=Flavobacterium urocaniciphilum TaxID=1299341 RepID=A0A1H9AS60_9FLAO|nr:gliding motility protein GldN [Flavobacterium urocaniciphilum]SEP79233.1 protein involved in gliding motility GldN [Flavobacterium urocaniciphilum]
MNWRNFLLVSVFSLSTFSFAQSNLLNAKTPAEIGKKTQAELNADNDKPLPYGYVGDRDILMGKAVWELIDVNQRVNFPMYYPVDDSKDLGTDRLPLYQVLMNGIKDKKITEVYDSGYFTTKKTYEEIEKVLSFKDTLDQGIEELNSGATKISDEFIVKYEIKPIDVAGYRVKGFWYFDKRQGELKYRLLGICPVVPDVYTLKGGSDKQEYVDLFWIYFPDSREVLHQAKAFNEKNSAMPFSFDHLLNSRRFSGVIYLEENVYGDREIKDYMKENSQMQLLESERVKEKIRNFELDMWNY